MSDASVGTTTAVSRPIERLRLFAVSLALTLVIVAQDTGRTAADTKLDLVVDPARFLRQAVWLWDPLGDGGRVQNQAYGYLFPMGPFFAFARWVDVPPWAAQRLWESALVVAAFLGTYHVARALGVARFWSAVGAGLAFALTPRVLAEITSNSAELLPTMVLPWVLLPLIRGAEGGSPRRAAALSAIALLFAGGTNAGATLAILPVPIVWLVTRARGARRAALLRWSAIAIPLAMIWWAIPLLLLGRYSPRFVDWIEAAENTTVSTSLLAALRGVSHWVTYLGPAYWPAGWIYVSTPAMVVATAAVAAVGLGGLSSRGVPHRLFLCSCLGLGLVAVTFGHPASVGPTFDATARALLDGPLVAFRNVHKFQGLITLPLAIGLGFAVDRLRLQAPAWMRARGRPLITPARWVLVGGAVCLGAAAVGPALGNRLVAAAREDPVARYWEGAARWLAANGEGTRALVVPGAPFPTYLWGETVDDAVQPVARSPWVVRNALPLAQPGLIRVLDVVEGRLEAGRSDDSLADLLARAGIGFVVLRHDLDSFASQSVPQSLVRSTLQKSPGFERATAIGPRIGEPGGRAWLVDGGLGGAHPAIEIYEVLPASGPVALRSAEATIRSNGSTDSLATLVDGGLPITTPVLFGSDGIGLDLGTTVSVATDGVRRQQDAFGGRFRRSATLSAAEPFRGDRRVFDYLPDGVGELSTFRYVGIADVSASSSGADVRAVFNANPAYAPWSALDGDPKSAWRSASWNGAVDEWLEVRFTEPIDVHSIDIAFAEAFVPFPERLEITTDTASTTVRVRANSSLQKVVVPPGRTTTLRLTARAVAGGGPGTTFGIAQLVIPGVSPQRTLDVPGVGSPAAIHFAVAPGYRSGCVEVSGGVTCDATWASMGEEDGVVDRSVTLSELRSYEVAATVRPVPGPELDRLLDAGLPVRATATSVDGLDPRHRAGAAVDGDPLTAWVAAPGDQTPTLSLDLGDARIVRALRIVTDQRAPVARPTVVWVRAGDTGWIGPLAPDGLIRLPSPTTTDTVEITVVEAELRRSISSHDLSVRWLPVAINEVRLDPAPPAEPVVAPMIEIGCDAGPVVVIDGAPIPLSVSASRADVLAGETLVAEPCGDTMISLEPGEHRFTLAATETVAPMTLAMTDMDLSAESPDAGNANVEQWDATSRRVRVDARATSILVVHENFNDGWTARIDGQPLEAVRVDGWQQGFVVPAAAAGVVEITYAPQSAFVAGLAVGATGIPMLLALAFIRTRAPALPAVGERVIGARTAVGLVLLVGWLLTGLAGLIAVIVMLLLGPLLFDRRARILRFVGPGLLAAAGVAVAMAPTKAMIAESSSPRVQTLAVVAVAATFLAGFGRSGRDP